MHVLAGKMLQMLPKGPRILPILGGPLRGRRFCGNLSFRPHYYVGRYEPKVVAAVMEALAPGQVAYDIGANAGYISLVMAKRVAGHRKAGQVYSFEPAPNAFQILVTNTLLNRDLPIQPFQTALSNRTGIEAFSFFEYDLVSRLGNHSQQWTDAQVTRVRTETLDHLVTDFELRPPNFLKIDVEGAELDVLCGAEALLRAHHPDVLIEVHSPDLEANVIAWLSSLAYNHEVISEEMPKHLRFTAKR